MWSLPYTPARNIALHTSVEDTVNLAASIETYTKHVGRPIRFDAETRACLPDSLQVDSSGEVAFKGKTLSVQVYSVGTVSH